MHTFTHLERKKHGTLEFPVDYYYVDSRLTFHQMPFHWHNEWEIVRILDGSMQFYLDDAQYALRAGDILLIRSGTLHGSDPTTCVYESLDFDLYGLFRKLDMVKSYLRPFYRLLSVPQCYFRASEYPELAAIVDKLMFAFSADRENACQELETIAYISSLFAWIINHNCYQKAPENEEFSSRKIDVIKAVLEYIESNYSTNISLNSMAHIAGMNPKYFCRVFRSLTHHSPIDYLNFYRVEQAAHLLDTMDISVTSVGAECGFSESSYFTKVFRKYKGVTPKAYRQISMGTKTAK